MSSYPQWSNLNNRQQEAVERAYNEGVLRKDSYLEFKYGSLSDTTPMYNYDSGPATSKATGWPPIVYSWGLPNLK